MRHVVWLIFLAMMLAAADESHGRDIDVGTDEGMAILSRCNASMASTDLDPIRTKVLLTSPATGTPVSILANHDLPTPAEQEAIGKWSQIRDQCEAEFREFIHSPRAFPRMSAFERAQIGLIWDEGLTFIRELVLALYERRLNYGDFAIRRAAASIEIQRAEQQTREAILIGDPRLRLSHLSAISQRLRDALASQKPPEAISP
jgi:hypothetical protein